MMGKPKIRFKGYNEDWEQRKLGELGEIMTGSTPSTSNSEYYSEDGIPWVTPTDINSQTISDTPRKLSEEGMKVGRVVPANTILCTCIASIGKNTLLTVKGSFNQQINCLTPNEYNDAYFLLTESVFWSNIMKRMAAAGTMQIVNKTEFSELTTMVPKLEEQKKIGQYFRALDHLITLHQHKCDEMKKLKKYMLQKMFPKNGKKVPEIRFDGFTNDWEQRKLGEYVEITSGEAPAKFQEGDINYVKVDDLNYACKTVINTQNKVLKNSSVKMVQAGSVIFPKRGAAILTNKVRVLGVDSYMDTNMMALSSEKLDTNFLYTMLSKEGLYKIADTSTIPQINNKHIEPYKIYLPGMDEQQKIGTYFDTLDHLITLHQHKCDELQNFKKYMLQNMFV